MLEPVQRMQSIFKVRGMEASVSFMRLSDDKVTNAFENMCLDVCSVFKCSVLNGLVHSHCDGSSTFVTQNGSSVMITLFCQMS